MAIARMRPTNLKYCKWCSLHSPESGLSAAYSCHCREREEGREGRAFGVKISYAEVMYVQWTYVTALATNQENCADCTARLAHSCLPTNQCTVYTYNSSTLHYSSTMVYCVY